MFKMADAETENIKEDRSCSQRLWKLKTFTEKLQSIWRHLFMSQERIRMDGNIEGKQNDDDDDDDVRSRQQPNDI
jgi:hypothetical protein